MFSFRAAGGYWVDIYRCWDEMGRDWMFGCMIYGDGGWKVFERYLYLLMNFVR